MAKKYQEYRVVWEIDVYATSAKEAAERSLQIQRDQSALATVFDVTPMEGSNKGKTTRIDLSKLQKTL